MPSESPPGVCVQGRRLSRKLLQDGQLVQPGVELKSVVQTDDGSAQPVAEAITNALAQPYQLVSVYKSVRSQQICTPRATLLPLKHSLNTKRWFNLHLIHLTRHLLVSETFCNIIWGCNPKCT